MTNISARPSVPPMDGCSRTLIIFASFFTIAALALSIVGILTPSWYNFQDSNGNITYYNLFTQCTSNVKNGSSKCTEISRENNFGIGTLYAASFLIVAICLLGCGMLVVLAMNITRLAGIFIFVAPILLFLAALFMVASFAELSRVTLYNSYSAILVQTSHVATIFSLGLIAFAAGRLQNYFYQRF
ncbi:hypothetical protein I4U23_019613 [Adineta vaga]|nr:hypothetical protein I4U23_019613 [Adineta vaga]